MKVVVDTNVVVSAALKDRNPETVILFVVKRPEFAWVAWSDLTTDKVKRGEVLWAKEKPTD